MEELRVERNLLNNSFEGYKLNSNGLNITGKPLLTKVHNPEQDPNNFTFNYTRQQLMQNHLFYNQWNDSVYLVDENLNVVLLSSETVMFFFMEKDL